MPQSASATVPSSYTPTYRRETLCVFWDLESVGRGRRRDGTTELEGPAAELSPDPPAHDTQVDQTQVDRTQVDRIAAESACGLDVLPSDELGLDRPLFDFLADPPPFQLSILGQRARAEDETTHVCTVVEPARYTPPSRPPTEVRIAGIPPVPRDALTVRARRPTPRSRPASRPKADP